VGCFFLHDMTIASYTVTPMIPYVNDA
jgi:hypothetical protein